MDHLVYRYGSLHAVPTKIPIDFVLEMNKKTFNGLTNIFDRLADYQQADDKKIGCDYCCRGSEIEYKYDIREENNGYELYGYDQYGSETSATIYFCPMCGRELKGVSV